MSSSQNLRYYLVGAVVAHLLLLLLWIKGGHNNDIPYQNVRIHQTSGDTLSQSGEENAEASLPLFPQKKKSGDGKVALVTGGAGFIGSHVARHCLSLKMTVVVVDDLSGGYISNIPNGAQFYYGDIKDPKFVETLFEIYKFDFVYHLAAYAAEGLSHFIRSYNYRNNMVGSIELINQAVKHKVDCFIFTSSIAVYGAGQTPMVESMTPMPEDPYGVSKYAVELDLKAAKHMFDMDFVVFRPHNVYGPHQNIYDKYRNVIGIFMNQILRGEPLSIFGDGLQRRAFSYIDDVAPIIAEGPLVKGARNQVFNVGADVPYTINDLAKYIATAMGKTVQIKYHDARKEVLEAHSDHRKVRAFFGTKAPTDIKEGLRKMYQWWKKLRIGVMTPTSFSAVEVLEHLPPSWKKAGMKQVSRMNVEGVCPVKNNLDTAESFETVSTNLVAAYRKKVDRALERTQKPLSWRHPQGKSRTLLSIHTAVSYWHITELMLVSLAAVNDDFDVILIDDKSKKVDIVSKAKSFGVFVLEWDGSEPLGLTHSWNLAWQYFMKHANYDNLIICNNDLVVPNGVINKLSAALDSGWGWVLPIVSHRGSGNPLHRLEDYFPAMKTKKSRVWTDDILQYQNVQNVLDAERPSQSAKIVNSVHLPNGYMMAFNKKLMKGAQYSKFNTTLFNPKFLNTGNEDDLFKRIKSMSESVPVGVHTGAFVHHHKGYTLFESKYGKRDSPEQNRNVVGEGNYLRSE